MTAVAGMAVGARPSAPMLAACPSHQALGCGLHGRELLCPAGTPGSAVVAPCDNGVEAEARRV